MGCIRRVARKSYEGVPTFSSVPPQNAQLVGALLGLVPSFASSSEKPSTSIRRFERLLDQRHALLDALAQRPFDRLLPRRGA